MGALSREKQPEAQARVPESDELGQVETSTLNEQPK